MKNEGAPKYNPRERLLWLKSEFRDEIPAEIIHSNSVNNKFKVRRNWFQGLVADLGNLINENKIQDKEVRAEVEFFLKYITSDEFKNKPLTDKEDIERANRLIDMVLEKLPL